MVLANNKRYQLTVPVGVQEGQTFRVYLAPNPNTSPRPPPPQPPVPMAPPAATEPSPINFAQRMAQRMAQAAPPSTTQGMTQGIVQSMAQGLADTSDDPSISSISQAEPRAVLPGPKPAVVRPPIKTQPELPTEPPEKLEMQLSSPYSMRTAEGELVLDKRVFTINVSVKDGKGERTGAPIALSATLIYEDRTPLLPPEVQNSALVGNTTVLAKRTSSVDFKLRASQVSRAHNGKKFRVAISPQEHALAEAHPGLVVHSEPFLVISHVNEKSVAALNKPKPPPPKPPPATSILGAPKPTISKPAPLPKLISNVAPPAPPKPDARAASSNIAMAAAALTRRRYFPADAIKAAVAPPPEDDANSLPLTRSGIAAVDFLATMVTQQLTARACQHARKTRPRTKRLLGSDVAAIVRKGMFDFLHEARVTSEWEIAESSVTSTVSPAVVEQTASRAALPDLNPISQGAVSNLDPMNQIAEPEVNATAPAVAAIEPNEKSDAPNQPEAMELEFPASEFPASVPTDE